MLVNPRCIDSSEKNESILLVLSDPYCRKILSSVSKKAKTIDEISNELGLSKSTIYRKVHWLEKTKLVQVSGTISDDGCKRFYYQSRIDSILTIYFDEGHIIKISQERKETEY
ncbi:winged helix-turn-helix domain-containing protein [Nitrosopumilus sp.]|uniref:ArsR/SmtB family transcription factor n=1 Tax=Nitrosopumilus sp. TaxID=2024843 RepID=UPI00293030E8|nr:winged helix-turn-helix domain-containing protein [Nitrosopumilus sp.]